MQLRRLALSLVLAIGLVTIVIGFMQAETDEDDVPVTDAAIERQLPEPGELVLRQSQVGVDLISGYSGVLQIDGLEIPEDQLFIDEALNQVFFTPDAGLDIEEFEPGRHCITAVFWPTVDGREAGERRSTWCFNVS